MTTTTPAAKRYKLGAREASGRYPVTVDGRMSGDIHRFHGEWYARPRGHSEDTRIGDQEAAAKYLVVLVDSGAVDLNASDVPDADSTVNAGGVVPWLTARMKPGRRNILSAGIALARLAELAWTPTDGENTTPYPGSDNPWILRCELCGKTVTRWWSHLRGRNGDDTPRPENRHEGCIDFEDQAGKVAALVGEPPANCPCRETSHPTTAGDVEQLLGRAERAHRADDVDALRPLLMQLLGPCPASSARAEAMKTFLPKRKS